MRGRILKAIIIREPWIGLILRGEKTWEMRSKRTKETGLVGLIRKGSKHVVGIARLTGCLPPLSAHNYAAMEHLHRVPPPEQPGALARNWVYPWVLSDAQPLKRSIPYNHSSQVTWVDLEPEVERQIVEQWRSI